MAVFKKVCSLLVTIVFSLTNLNIALLYASPQGNQYNCLSPRSLVQESKLPTNGELEQIKRIFVDISAKQESAYLDLAQLLESKSKLWVMTALSENQKEEFSYLLDLLAEVSADKAMVSKIAALDIAGDPILKQFDINADSTLKELYFGVLASKEIENIDKGIVKAVDVSSFELQTLDNFDVENKKVLMRVDFNVPIVEGKITDATRIEAALPTINYLLSKGCKIVLMSHSGRPKGEVNDKFSLAPVAKVLAELLNKEVKFASDCIGAEVKEKARSLQSGEILLLENLRFHKEEEENSKEFAAKLVADSGAKIFINDAFGTAHRAHASTYMVATMIPSATGFLMKKEVEFLDDKISNPNRPLTVIVGGSKVASKIGVFENLIKNKMQKGDNIIIGGGMAYTFLKEKGFNVGNSIAKDDLSLANTAKAILKAAEEKGINIILPTDVISADHFTMDSNEEILLKDVDFEKGEVIAAKWQGLDIGKNSQRKIAEVVAKSGTVLWNGPVGVFENNKLERGTYAVAKAIVQESIKRDKNLLGILGGGDTVSAFNQFKAEIAKDLGLSVEVVEKAISHISTGGGASLEMIEGKKLPGVEVLKKIKVDTITMIPFYSRLAWELQRLGENVSQEIVQAREVMSVFDKIGKDKSLLDDDAKLNAIAKQLTKLSFSADPAYMYQKGMIFLVDQFEIERSKNNINIADLDKKMDVIVVMGSERNDYAAKKAAQLYNNAPANRKPLIITSGKGGGQVAEATVIANLLKDAGIPESVIIEETKSSSAVENLEFSLAKFKNIDKENIDKKILDRLGKLKSFNVVQIQYSAMMGRHAFGDKRITDWKESKEVKQAGWKVYPVATDIPEVIKLVKFFEIEKLRATKEDADKWMAQIVNYIKQAGTSRDGKEILSRISNLLQNNSITEENVPEVIRQVTLMVEGVKLDKDNVFNTDKLKMSAVKTIITGISNLLKNNSITEENVPEAIKQVVLVLERNLAEKNNIKDKIKVIKYGLKQAEKEIFKGKVIRGVDFKGDADVFLKLGSMSGVVAGNLQNLARTKRIEIPLSFLSMNRIAEEAASVLPTIIIEKGAKVTDANIVEISTILEKQPNVKNILLSATIGEAPALIEVIKKEQSNTQAVLDALKGEQYLRSQILKYLQGGSITDKMKAKIKSLLNDDALFNELFAEKGVSEIGSSTKITQLNVADMDYFDKNLDAIIEANNADPKNILKTSQSLMAFSEKFNYLDVKGDQKVQDKFNEILVKKSKFARDIGLAWIKTIKKTDPEYKQIVETIFKAGMVNIISYADRCVASGDVSADTRNKTIALTEKLLPEWLSENNNIPEFVIAGLLRGLLEGRSEDILFDFGKGWRMFGTAGIRNPSVQSSFGVIADLELSEFAGTEEGVSGEHAPVLTGPNLMNVITMLQQQQAITNAYREIQAAIANGTIEQMIKDKELDPRFVEDVKNNKVSIAYDSRINGKFYAHMLAAAFLESSIKVDIFDRPAGVPPIVYQASEDSKNRSAIAILISASHSEANYNGFKAFLSCQRSQVDKAGKNIIVAQRPKIADVGLPYKMDSAMGGNTMEDFDAVFKKYNKGDVKLTWFGKTNFNPETNQEGAEFDNTFYDRFYAHIEELLPSKSLGLSAEEMKKVEAARAELKTFYTAFAGCGSDNAQDFTGFLKHCGFTDVTVNENQTLKHDGRFAGFNNPGGDFGMPDPGVVKGWVVNFLELLQQEAGKELDIKKLEKAVSELMNLFDVGLATDPDIDRAGIVLSLLEGMEGGNLKNPIIETVINALKKQNANPEHINVVKNLLEDTLHEKLLLTANEAWTFIVFWKFQLMHERGKLDKNKLYIIEKSHVTTDALVRVADYFKDTYGYKVSVVDTFVGFTELAKKSRDLIDNIARCAWFINRKLDDSATSIDAYNVLVTELKKVNAELMKNVMYQRRGVSFITDTINKLENFLKDPSADRKEIMADLAVIAHMEIPMGVEESNGYGEFGVFLPNEDFRSETNDVNWKNQDVGSRAKEHISEKDGSLAGVEFADLLAIGKGLKDKKPFEMYLDVVKAIGAVGTDNRFIQYKGLTGDEKKLDAINFFEKTFGPLLKKAVDKGQQPMLFNGKYKVVDVETYRDAKYDVFWPGFPEEGIRLIMEDTKTKSKLFCTFRPSGTGANNRAYNWVFGAQEYKGKKVTEMNYQELNDYRVGIVDTLNEMADDFFGVQDKLIGYADKPKATFSGLLSALGEVNADRYNELIAKVVDDAQLAKGLTMSEDTMKNAADKFARDLGAYADKNGKIFFKDSEGQKLRFKNRLDWDSFLQSEEVKNYPEDKMLSFAVNGKDILKVPAAYAYAWQTSLIDYLAALISKEVDGKEWTITGTDDQIIDLLKHRYADYTVLSAAQEQVLLQEIEREQVIAPRQEKAKPQVTLGVLLQEKFNEVPGVVASVNSLKANSEAFKLAA